MRFRQFRDCCSACAVAAITLTCRHHHLRPRGASSGVPLNDAVLNPAAGLCRAHVRVSRNHQPVEG